MGITFDLDDHSKEVERALRLASEIALESIGNTAVSHAKQTVSSKGRIDICNLINSINRKVVERKVYLYRHE